MSPIKCLDIFFKLEAGGGAVFLPSFFLSCIFSGDIHLKNCSLAMSSVIFIFDSASHLHKA